MSAVFFNIRKWILTIRYGKCYIYASLLLACIALRNTTNKQKINGLGMVSYLHIFISINTSITPRGSFSIDLLSHTVRDDSDFFSAIFSKDPAFVAIMVYFMAVSALGYAIAFHKKLGGFLKGILYAVIVDFGLVGVIVATLGWYFANQYLLVDSTGSHTTEQKVEWLYAFDVHCNSFFPFFMLLYVIQYFLLLVFMREGFVFIFLANATYALAFSYYLYVTFLGYDALPFLQNTTVFLYPIVGVIVVFLLACLLKWNICRIVMTSYFG